ncbi:MAG: cache domain-containing protein [Syntrophobacteraceae bacterium]
MRARTDAKAFVEKAAAFLKSSGKRIALAEFTRPDGAFVEDELYIFTLNSRGTMLAHGVNERFVGEEFLGLQDSDGKFFIREIVDGANSGGSGWVEYKWFHPITKKWLPKVVYYEKVDDLILCCGVYNHAKVD